MCNINVWILVAQLNDVDDDNDKSYEAIPIFDSSSERWEY